MCRGNSKMGCMCSQPLLRFWKELDLATPPFLHKQDTERIPANRIQMNVLTNTDYMREYSEGTLSRTAFHPALLPQPYLGDLENADILILLLNPGLHHADYHAEENYPEYRDLLVASILQQKRDHLFLDPKWAWTSGFSWWEKKLRGVAEIIANERHEGRFGLALEQLSKRIVSIELVPYHSIDFGPDLRLFSSDQARSFVAKAATSEERTVIVTRGVERWLLPDQPNVVKYPASLARGASLSPSSPGGHAILQKFGIDC